MYCGIPQYQIPNVLPGANSLKKPYHIVILRFSEVLKGHAKCVYIVKGAAAARLLKSLIECIFLFLQPAHNFKMHFSSFFNVFRNQ